MPLNITVSFEPIRNAAYFDIDTSQMTNSNNAGLVLCNGFRRLSDKDMAALFALNENVPAVQVTQRMSEWRQVARSVERSMASGHLWDIPKEDCSIQWHDEQGTSYASAQDIPAHGDAVHRLGETSVVDFLRVGDPCYRWTESEDTEVKVAPGTWAFELTTRDDNEHGMSNGHRPARLVAYCTNAHPVNIEELLSSTQPHAFCGVDSATCGFMFDVPMPSESTAKDEWYDAVVGAILNDEKEGPDVAFQPELNAVVASTFLGDGSYPMFVQYNTSGQAIAAVLVTDNQDPLLRKNPGIAQDVDEDTPEV